MNGKQVVLVGGFCEMYELCWRCGLKIAGVIDATPTSVHGYDIPYLGNDECVLADPAKFSQFPLVVVPDAPEARQRIVDKYRLVGFKFASVISPDADISPTSILGEGIIIQSHVVITAQVAIGSFVKLNIGVKIFHECVIGDYATVAPDATLLGRIRIGQESYIGAASTILPNRVVGKGCMIGAGSVVTHNVPDRYVMAGVPARAIKDA